MSSDVLARIQERGHIGIRLGLDRMRALLSRLDDPQQALRGVLIGGTNGKGSVGAMLATMCKEAGVRASHSPSPHLHSYRERIIIDGQPIGADDLDSILEEVLLASEHGEGRHGPATEFELLTAAAFLWSARQQVEVVIMEVGLGGRLDATNTWQADVAAITNVALDHQQYLGHTVEAVAREKAAIIKRGSRAVTAAHGAALTIIMRRARTLDVPLTVCEALPIEQMDRSGLGLRHERMGQLHLALLGRHQAQNAATALAVAAALDQAGVVSIDDASQVRGLAQTRWPGRLELLDRRGRPVILDGAHNPDGAAALAAAIDDLKGSLPPGRATLLLGIMRDKEVSDVLTALTRADALRKARFVAAAVPDTDRSLSAAELATAWEETAGTVPAAAIEDADAALDRALAIAADEGGPLIVAGSLYLVGHIRARLLPAGVEG
ncbi:MAG: folylpolyglutamate synthase/dihydrofolate synthase family protein [Chloroflexota bacterium]